jgi:hypothetical protein
MTYSSRNQLLALIRLLHDDLSAEAGVQLRAELAASLTLARQYQQVMQSVDGDLSADEQDEYQDQVPAELIAGFVDGTIDENQQQELVSHCWQSPLLLREIVMTWRAVHRPDDAVDATMSEAEMMQLALRTAVAESKGALKTERRTLMDDLSLASSVSAQSGSLQQWFRQPAMLVTTASLLVILAVVAVMYGTQDGDRPVVDHQEDLQNTDRNPSPQDVDDHSTTEDLVSDDRQPVDNKVVPDRQPDQNAPPDSVVNNPDREMLVQSVPPDNSPAPDESPDNVPEKPNIPDPSPTMTDSGRLLVAGWTADHGVVGVQQTDADQTWHGINSRAVLTMGRSDATTRLATLAGSRATLEMNSGFELVVDAHSMIDLFGELAADDQPTVVVSPNYGRCGLVGLTGTSQVAVRIGGLTIPIEVDGDNVAFGVDRQGDSVEFAVWRGEAVVSGHTVSRRCWLSMNRAGQFAEIEGRSEDADWYRGKLRREVIPTELAVALNNCSDMVAEALTFDAAGQPEMAFFATQAVLQFTPAQSRQLPVQLIGRLAGSHVEAQRQSLIEWILLTLKNRSIGRRQFLDEVCTAAGLDMTVHTDVRGWFIAALAERKPSLAELSKLSAGLRDQSSLFKRQCAKYFLQRILGDPLSEYDPAQPLNRATMNGINAKLRAWQQANQ